MNACIGGSGVAAGDKDRNGVKKEIASYGGIPVLISLLTSDSNKISPCIIKQRASGLLGRCLTCSECARALIEDEEGAKKICETLVKVR